MSSSCFFFINCSFKLGCFKKLTPASKIISTNDRFPCVYSKFIQSHHNSIKINLKYHLFTLYNIHIFIILKTKNVLPTSMCPNKLHASLYNFLIWLICLFDIETMLNVSYSNIFLYNWWDFGSRVFKVLKILRPLVMSNDRTRHSK